MRPKVVLHILWDGGFGGAQKFASDIIAYSDRNMFKHIVVFLTKSGWFGDLMINKGAEVFCLGMKNKFSIMRALRLQGIIQKVSPDIIHNHARNYLANAIILKYPHILKIYFEHGGDLLREDPKIEVLFYNLFGHFYDLILTNSSFVKKEIIRLTKIRSEKIKLFFIGIDPEIYKSGLPKDELRVKLGIPKENKIVGTVGRIVAQKGLDDFVRVAAKMKRMDEKLSFIVIGDGPLKETLTKVAQENSVDIHFLGYRNDVPEIINIFDLFIITSKWEPFGIVVLEALASKIPVVGFSVPGMKEIFEKGGGGILLIEREPLKLAEIAIGILADGDRYKALSDEGYKNVRENFDIRKNIKKLEEDYLLLAKIDKF